MQTSWSDLKLKLSGGTVMTRSSMPSKIHDMCMYVCLYIYMWYVCICTYVYAHVHVHVCVYMYTQLIAVCLFFM